jgi:hypothetical protein
VRKIETYKDNVKVTFAKGPRWKTRPVWSGLFSASLDAGTRRAVNLREGNVVDEEAFVDWFARPSPTIGPNTRLGSMRRCRCPGAPRNMSQ